MTFVEYANRSVNPLRVLVQLDVSKINTQWINAGAGIWYVNFSATYPEVDSSLLDGFTVQSFGDIGSLIVDTTNYTKMTDLLSVTTTENSFYYDSTEGEVFVHFVNNDDHILHDIFFGVVHGFSYDDFTPIDSLTPYIGRINSNIEIKQARDPLFFGKIQFDTGSVSLLNSDGEFDTFAIDNNLYGNEVRILLGFEDISINDYLTVYTALVENVSVDEEIFTIGISDKRKKFTKEITYTCNSKNALEVIRELLSLYYGAIYNSTYYDTTAWAASEALAPLISIDIQDGKAIEDISVIDLIEDICASVFGIFKITADNKYSFKIVDTTATASTTIYAHDILNNHSINYDPSEVITSIKMGYNKNWESGYTSPYTWYTDTSQEETIYKKYKVYNQKEFFSIIENLSSATSLATTVLNYSKDVHGIGEVLVPIKYYAMEVGDIVNIEINRSTRTMLGTKKCEVISKGYQFPEGIIKLGYRII
jgi:hypothetical protein